MLQMPSISLVPRIDKTKIMCTKSNIKTTCCKCLLYHVYHVFDKTKIMCTKSNIKTTCCMQMPSISLVPRKWQERLNVAAAKLHFIYMYTKSEKVLCRKQSSTGYTIWAHLHIIGAPRATYDPHVANSFCIISTTYIWRYKNNSINCVFYVHVDEVLHRKQSCPGYTLWTHLHRNTDISQSGHFSVSEICRVGQFSVRWFSGPDISQLLVLQGRTILSPDISQLIYFKV